VLAEAFDDFDVDRCEGFELAEKGSDVAELPVFHGWVFYTEVEGVVLE
jgi:hypothetical protein